MSLEAAATDIDLPTPRPLTLGDTMILIIALALGLAFARPTLAVVADAIHPLSQGSWRNRAWFVQLALAGNVASLYFFLSLIVACLILRLKRPRPPLRLLVHQPGFAGCAAVIAFFLVGAFVSILAQSGPGNQFINMVGMMLPATAAPLAWGRLIAKGRWAPEPSWIDRFGRILGVVWTAALLANFILVRLLF